MKAKKLILFVLLAIMLSTFACGGGASTRDEMINRAVDYVASLNPTHCDEHLIPFGTGRISNPKKYVTWEWCKACMGLTVDDPPLYGRVESSKQGVWHIQVFYGEPHYGVQLGTWEVREDTVAVSPVGRPAIYVH